MTLTLTTSVLNHLIHAAPSTAPHHALSTAATVWRGWRPTTSSTLRADAPTLAWLEEELAYLLWQLRNRRLLTAQAGIAPSQVERCLDTVRTARRTTPAEN